MYLFGFFSLQRKTEFLFCKEKQTIWEEMESIQAVYPVTGRMQPAEEDEKLLFRLLLTLTRVTWSVYQRCIPENQCLSQ